MGEMLPTVVPEVLDEVVAVSLPMGLAALVAAVAVEEMMVHRPEGATNKSPFLGARHAGNTGMNGQSAQRVGAANA